MSQCTEFECFVCNICKEGRPQQASEGNQKPQKSGQLDKPGSEGQWADALMVYVLGKLPNAHEKQLDIYSGVNGYLVRTIPGSRWRTPVKVGAGAGLVVMVDQFNDYDQLRFTDEYGGAGASGFDSNGSPKDSVQWDSLPDLYTYNIPRGYRVTGVSITSWGMCVANVTGGDGTATYFVIDATGHCGLKAVYRHQDPGMMRVVEPYREMGQIQGQCSQMNHNPSDEMFWNIYLITGQKNAVVAVDSLSGRVMGMQGLPASPQPMSAVFGNNVISVLCGDGTVGSVLYRFLVDPKRGANRFILAGAGSTAGPSDKTLTYSPSFQDDSKQDVVPEEALGKYLKRASKINERSTDREAPGALDNLPRYPGGKSSQELNEDRTASRTTLASPMYDNGNMDATKIELPASLGVIEIVGAFGTIAELFDRGGDVTKPLFRLVHSTGYDFIVDGGFSYGCSTSGGEFQGITSGLVGESIAVDKKYTLGQLVGLDVKAALIDANSGLIMFREPKPESDYRVYGGDYPALDPYVNKLQVEIDAIQDDINRLNGEMLEAQTEGRGTYATDLQEEITVNQAWKTTLQNRRNELGGSCPVSSTQCTTDAINTLEAVDGIERTGVLPWLSPWLDPKRPGDDPLAAPVSAFDATSGTLDDYWGCFIRKPSTPAKVTLALMRRNWTRSVFDEEGIEHLLPEWVSNNVNPIQSEGHVQLLVPPNTRSMLEEFPLMFNYVGRGGFYPIGLPTKGYTNLERYQEEISSLNDFDDDYQRIIDAENAKGEEMDAARVAQYQGYIADNAVRKSQLDAWLSGGKSEHDFQHIPRNILKVTFPNIDASPSQTPDENGQWAITDPVSQVSPATKWTSINIGDLKRGCVVEPGPYVWLGVATDFRATSMIGRNMWSYPEARRNGLGIRVGNLDYESLHPGYVSAFGIVGGGVYCSGWRTWADTGDAWAFWEWGVTALPDTTLVSPAAGVGLVSTSPAHIKLAAPTDAHGILLEDLGNNMGTYGDEVFLCRRYYYSMVPLRSVKVWFRMTHFAKDVFRVGIRTLYFGDTIGDSPICPKTDPGYWAGDNCEASACGNVTCGSAVSGLRYKLYSSDPTYPEVYTPILKGEANFTVPENPYTDMGLAYGTVMKLNVTFDLNNNVRGFDIPLIPSEPRREGQR